MLGLAQKKFLETGGKFSFKTASPYIPHHPWPLIEKMLASGALAYVDYAQAERLLRPFPHANQDVAAFLCHLSLSARQGHLCISVKDSVLPPPKDVWLAAWNENSQHTQSTKESTFEDFCELQNLIIEGAKNIPEELISEACEETKKPIYRTNELFYFQRFWHSEHLCIKHFSRITQSSPELTLDISTVSERLLALKQNGKLLPEQAQAILQACAQSITLICGGPGTGKTYTAGELIKIYWQSLSHEQQKSCKIALAAPTGKAAANLQHSLNRIISDLTDFNPIVGVTLHALLGIRFSKYKKSLPPYVNADLLIVDESSMIDVELMSKLLTALKPGARLIFLGDPNQLPPVSAGMLFSDMATEFTDHVVTLKTCLRTDLKEIVEFSDAIKAGNSSEVIHKMSSSHSVVSRICIENQSIQSMQSELITKAVSYFNIPINDDPSLMISAFNKFCLLSPLRKGPFGVDSLNALIMRQCMQRQQKGPFFIAPIMVVNNDRKMNLFNGEIGVLIRLKSDYPGLKKGDYALFPGLAGKEIRRFPALLLPKFEYAYCVSVHKSQGSEFDHVLLLMPDGSEIFGREVLYTAATRARKKLEIWGSDAVLNSALANATKRLSGLKYMI